ncbi:MAG: glycoside hydrolase family 127 protein [Planctomycetaceae bacterium]|nr:glycoside hydrolase family 127 protein [Planctomycetaceae bacterium]
MIKHLICVSALLLGFAITVSAQDSVPKNPMKAVPFTDVKLEDTFWKPRLETNRTVSIPHNYKWCEDTGRFDNFAKAAGLMDGEFRGIYFNDSDVYKLLEGTAYSLAAHPDPELEAAADKVIHWIAAAQRENGYLNSYYTLKEPDKKWSNTPVMHELYCLGHLTEAAVAYKQATGKTVLLDVVEKAIDHVIDTFGYEEGKKREVPGHEEIELALVKLYDLTGKEKYLTLSKFFIDIRGDQSKRTNRLQGIYQQDHKPVREQDEVVGHAVRAMYLYAGMTDIAAKTGDEALIHAVGKLWDSVVRHKMYITGGIGARHAGEAFGDDYEMPNDTAYCETCAQIGLALWAQRMYLMRHGRVETERIVEVRAEDLPPRARRRYGPGDFTDIDIVERVLYNGVLPGYALEGNLFFYPNPLSSKGNYGRQPFFDCACCPTNVVRFIPSIPGYLYATQGNTIIVNQYISSTATIELPDGVVTIKQETDYPWDGKLKFTFESVPNENAAEKFAMHFRVPNWGHDQQYGFGYIAPITVKWGEKFVQNIGFAMPVKRMVANPKIKNDNGRVALQRGPLVYCFEKCDNPDVDFANLTLAKEQDFQVEWKPDLLGGVNIIKCQDVEGRELVAIPYYAWAHRELTGMDVWVKQDGLPRKPKADDPVWSDTEWDGLLYRELDPATMFGESDPLTMQELTIVKASYCYPNDSVQAVFDGLEPKNSNDHDLPRLTWWNHLGTNEWLELHFDSPQQLSTFRVYWFDDEPRGGGCRIPASWSLSYRDGDKWVPVKTDDAFGVVKDRYNTVKFDSVETPSLRLDVKLQPGVSGGVLEIQVE